MLPNYREALYELLLTEIKREARLSERQTLLLEWNQIDGEILTTKLGREVRLCPATLKALNLINSDDGRKYIFAGSALLLPNKLEVDKSKGRNRMKVSKLIPLFRS